jgi:hypothetical protein
MNQKTDLVQKEDAAVVPASESTTMLSMIERAATNPDVDIEKMERLWEMKEKMDAKAAELAFNQAMAECQSKMKRIAADSNNPQTRSRYASYAALDKALRPVYTEVGLSLSFDTEDSLIENAVRIVCYVSHAQGHTRKYKTDMDASGLGAKGGAVMTKTHAAGSAMSYGMRYLLKMIFNVAIGEDDNDGNIEVCISINQALELQALAEDVGADIPNFLKYCGVEAFEQLPANRYEGAVKALEKKRAEK